MKLKRNECSFLQKINSNKDFCPNTENEGVSVYLKYVPKVLSRKKKS